MDRTTAARMWRPWSDSPAKELHWEQSAEGAWNLIMVKGEKRTFVAAAVPTFDELGPWCAMVGIAGKRVVETRFLKAVDARRWVQAAIKRAVPSVRFHTWRQVSPLPQALANLRDGRMTRFEYWQNKLASWNLAQWFALLMIGGSALVYVEYLLVDLFSR